MPIRLALLTAALLTAAVCLASMIARHTAGYPSLFPTTREIVSTATPVLVALEEYREVRGRYPETLQEIRPGHLAHRQTPSGHALRYRRELDGYSLGLGSRYSEGYFQGPPPKEWDPSRPAPPDDGPVEERFTWNGWTFARD